MSALPKKWMGVMVAAVLVGSLAVLAGCSSSAGSSSAAAGSESVSAASAAVEEASSAAAVSEEASSAAASSEEASPSAGMPNPWSDVASAEEAAKGAGLDSFPLPEGAIADLGEPIQVTYRCMDGMAQANYEFPASEVIVRTAAIADDESFDISGDYGEYKHEWTECVNNVSVACAGNREGESTVTYWGEDGIAHALVARGLGGDEDFGLTADRLAVFVEAMS